MNNRLSVTLAAALFFSGFADARLTRLVVEHRSTDRGFETLTGRFYGELDPTDPHNKIITDLEFAPRNTRGLVEYSATYTMTKPADMSKASGVLLYSVPNRGRGVPAASEGLVAVVSGWQGDLPPAAGLQTISVPVGKLPDGSPLTGPVIERFIDTPANTNTLSLNSGSYTGLLYQRPLTLDTSRASLTARRSRNAEPEPVASTEWAFADCTEKPFPGRPDPTKICSKRGFNPALEYTLVFTAKDPLILGIGYAATRDLNSFLKYAEKDEEGSENPVAKHIKWAISHGNSQSGNFIRSFVHLGFNQDEKGRIVWDGVNPHIAARQLAMNFRFAVPGGVAGPNEPGSDGVLWWSDYADEYRGRPPAGLLDRCRATNSCPKIVETFGGLEFWYLRESPNLVGTAAKADIPLPANVRRYFLPATSHGGGRGGFSTQTPSATKGCVLPANPNPETETMKALRVALVDWVTKGVEPPPSAYPRLSEGQLVPATRAAMGFPAIPGAPSPDGLVNPVYDYDFGPEFHYNDLSGVITKEPPQIKKIIPTLVPRVDSDGMDVGGVASVLRQAPLGTYLGWNVTASGFDNGTQCGLNGGYIPFAKTKAERVASNDTRPSLEERYRNHAGYLAAVRAAAHAAVMGRFLLQGDADRLIQEAEASDVLR
ncbi:MAG: alpha/beta hydrolase domain-containing protein [Bryobacteraceae bacterium]